MIPILKLSLEANGYTLGGGCRRSRGVRASLSDAIHEAASPHGFVVAAGGISSATRGITRRPAFLWMRQFLTAISWAAMIAGGVLIYSYFTEKWQAQGYPTVPVSALTTVGEAAARQRASSGLPTGGCPTSPRTGRPTNPHVSNNTGHYGSPVNHGYQQAILDEFEG